MTAHFTANLALLIAIGEMFHRIALDFRAKGYRHTAAIIGGTITTLLSVAGAIVITAVLELLP